MYKNYPLFSSHYLVTKNQLARECKKRELFVDDKYIDKCYELNYINPIKYGNQYYFDVFEIPVLAKIENQAKKIADIGKFKVKIKKSIQPIQEILPLAREVRYFYQNELHGVISSGIIPPFKLTKEEIKQFPTTWTTILDNSRTRYKPKRLLEKHKLDKKKILELRNKMFLSGYTIDPMADWYSFIKTVRQNDNQKFEKIKGKVLLAHDFYILAELLTLFYKDALDKDIIEPEDVVDLTGGKWKIRKCELCDKEIKVINSKQKFCNKCKKILAKEKGAHYLCSKCEKPLFKYIEGDEIFDKAPAGKKTIPGGRKRGANTISSINLIYGKARIFVQCDCGNLNHIEIDKGWY